MVTTQHRFSVVLPPPAVDALRAHAEARGTSMAQLVREATLDWLDANATRAYRTRAVVVPPHRVPRREAPTR